MQSITFARARRAAACLFAMATLVAAPAHAGTVQPEIGLAYAQGNGFGVAHDAGLWQIGLGYAFDNGFSVRAIAFGDINPLQDWLITQRSFKSFAGVQGQDAIALAPDWAAVIGAGFGQTTYNLPEDSPEARHATEGLVSAGLQWQPAKHFAMSLQWNHLTQSSVNGATLLFQVPF